MQKDLVLLKQEGHVAVLVLNRPDTLNALNTELLQEILTVLDQVQNNKKLRSLIITGTGDKAFCAGADLKERKTMSLAQTREFVALIKNAVNKVAEIAIPTIAAINGYAFGGGLELALACDFRILSANAQVGLTECALGIIPGAGGTQRLPRIVGITKAKEMIFGAQKIDAKMALQIGLADYVVEVSELLQRAKELTAEFSKNAPLSIRAAKKAIEQSLCLPLNEGVAFEAMCYEEILTSSDRLEALKAFAEKRLPDFQGN